MTLFAYDDFLQSPAGAQWRRLGAQRRAGVCAPLFSLHSHQSVGIGDPADLKKFSDWCAATGQSIVQLLPLNDMGYDFAPYSAKSSFALDPVYINLRDLRGAPPRRFEKEIRALAKRFPNTGRVNYTLKKAKVELLRKIFAHADRALPEFETFRTTASYWLRDDALYKILKGRFQGRAWEDWDPPYRDRAAEALAQLAREESEALAFEEWLQWQIFEQMRDAKRHAVSRGVYFMGDMPFLVARDSADVWAHRNYFKLHLVAGAPPDLYFAGGQRWGMPPYQWETLEAHNDDYLREKLRYAEHFYDLFRIDHVIGVFRVYTIPNDAPPDRGGLDGVFDPADESTWDAHGRRILKVMVDATPLLPCGEDLGVVPPCSSPALADFAIPGLEVQRWTRDWGKTYAFKPSDQYRRNACAVVSTHDMTPFAAWWEDEAGTVDPLDFQMKCQNRGWQTEDLRARLFEPTPTAGGRWRWRPEVSDENVLLNLLQRGREESWDFLDLFRATRFEKNQFWSALGGEGPAPETVSSALVERALTWAGQSAAIFSIQLLFDWLSVGPGLPGPARTYRVNLPGSVGDHNWSVRCPLTLEELEQWPGKSILRHINQSTGRA